MATSTEIKQRANTLADKTDVNSITPKEVGGIMYDLASHGENVLRNGGTLGIRKVYESVAAMEADSTNPKDFWGDPIKKGNLVVIYDGTTTGVDNNKIYAFMKPGWELATKLDAAYATKAETDAKLSELGSKVKDIKQEDATEFEEYIELKSSKGDSLLRIDEKRAVVKNLKISKEGVELDVVEEMERLDVAKKDHIANLEEEVILNDNDGTILKLNKKGLEARDILVNGDSIFSVSPNMLDDSKSKFGLVYGNGGLDENITTYKYSEYIDVSRYIGRTVYFSLDSKREWKVRFISAYDSNKNALPSLGVANASTYIVQEGTSYIRLSWLATISDGKQAEIDGITPYAPFGAKRIKINAEQIYGIIEESINQKMAQSNVLYGKKWWACGDSFTEWTTEQYNQGEYPNITSVNGYTYKSYPFWIGARNNMVVHNYAVSGQTMAYPTVREDGSISNFKNSFANELYKKIPSDVDYITLWFGINDSHHRPGSGGGDGESNEGVITLGAIDDVDTDTFYGAWNVVMRYLIENHPYAKIGIICTNGAETDEYALAELEIAKKWGVAFLDLNGSYKIPLMHRVNGKDLVCEEAHLLRKSAFWASSENGHPNVKAQEYQSTFIENWLRSL